MSSFRPETVVQFTTEELEEYWDYFTDQIENNPNPMARDAADLCLQNAFACKAGSRPLHRRSTARTTRLHGFGRSPNVSHARNYQPLHGDMAMINDMTADADRLTGLYHSLFEENPPAMHYLKTVAPYFEQVAAGNKPFELRKDDRAGGFAVGDILTLNEYDPEYDQYSGRQIIARVTSIVRHGAFPEALSEGHVIMGILVVAVLFNDPPTPEMIKGWGKMPTRRIQS